MLVVRASDGMTLIELCVVVTLVTLVASIALPSLDNVRVNTQRRSETHDLISFFAFARQEAVLRAETMTICPINTNGRCGRDWNKPLVTFSDPHNTRKITTPDQILKTLPAPRNGYRKVASLSRSYFQYRANGTILSDLGNITWCPEHAQAVGSAHLILNRGGRIRVAPDHDGDGIPEKADGKPVEC
ncbi:GspH/FimT family pseudopilin [Marinobacter shengliensis]|uniref:GspH/FimT family pseudopilin n=2 Tax=Marinobacter shengliensis TaxID=1389223 RepID=UPI0035B6B17D